MVSDNYGDIPVTITYSCPFTRFCKGQAVTSLGIIFYGYYSLY